MESKDPAEGSAERHTSVTAGGSTDAEAQAEAARKRRRGSRGGKNRRRPPGEAGSDDHFDDDHDEPTQAPSRRPQIGDTRPAPQAPKPQPQPSAEARGGEAAKKKRRRGGRGKSRNGGGQQRTSVDTDAEIIERRKGRERNGRPVGRYMMCVQVRDGVTQVAVMEGRSLIEHYVSRPSDDVGQIHGNIY